MPSYRPKTGQIIVKRIKTQKPFQTKIFATKGNVVLLLCRPKSALPELHIFKTAHMSKEPTVLPGKPLFGKDKNQQGVVVVCIEDGKTMDRVMHQSLCLCLQQLPTSSLLPYIMHSRKLSLLSFCGIDC